MELNDYQKAALSTAIYPNDGNISYLALAICGEAGELADKVKKVLRDKDSNFTETDKRALALELGDVMWYAANIAYVLGYDLSEIAQMNREKVAERIERGTLHGDGDYR